ncbi:hypothetical protein H0W26_02500 [Candidatus Dependentiae bacterium]|nr:hypothetical protein [Candidatus Dependentiae bacterium]
MSDNPKQGLLVIVSNTSEVPSIDLENCLMTTESSITKNPSCKKGLM